MRSGRKRGLKRAAGNTTACCQFMCRIEGGAGGGGKEGGMSPQGARASNLDPD